MKSQDHINLKECGQSPDLQFISDAHATQLPFAVYNAFTDIPFSGSQAAVVLNASSISHKNRSRIASEIGYPATSFVNTVDGNQITAQFFSTVMELPMCGHGTVCLITNLVESGLLPCENYDWHEAILILPNTKARVEYRRNSKARIEVMLDVKSSKFTAANLNFTELAQILSIDKKDYSVNLEPKISTADFIHLCLPMRDLKAMKSLEPDFIALAKFCVSNGLETVATFTTQVEESSQDIHVRDFCPAVGVNESAAAGTTNAALAHYLLHNGIVSPSDMTNKVTVKSEQGIELNRPSKIRTILTTSDDQISRSQVGGVATLILNGWLNAGILSE